MRRLCPPLLTTVAVVAAVCLTAAAASADNGKASPTLSFFSGGDGANAHWVTTLDQPPGDTDHQAIQIQTTDDAPTFSQGYAGILAHHVTGIPAADFPDSEFWVKTPAFAGDSLGSPRLVVEFQDAAGNFDGYGDLRPLTLSPMWQDVSDTSSYPASGWDVMGGPAPCGFVFNVKWQDVQTCFAGDTVLSVFIVADAYGINHLIDDITVDGKRFSSASDNENGDNDPAGPAATLDPSLLPPLLFPPL
jgi:hypothetical protein